MTREPLLDVPEGKPRSERLGRPVHPVTAEDWFAAAPPEPAMLESAPGELAPPGPAAVRNYVDIPAEP
jgi:hypothetical protein